jgi:uncharacterized SAM-binding protein YcdF (DUF218 family)
LRCFKLLVLALICAVLVYFGRGFLLEKAGAYLYKKDEFKPADAIVVLAGEEKERVEYGAKLFKEGWARKDRIIMSGGPAVWKYSWASLMKAQAVCLGVSGNSIIVEDRSRSTEENAIFTKEILVKRGYKSIILVTSPYHSKRASVIFGRVLGSGIKIISAPSEESWFKFDDWWKRVRDRDMVLSEYSKFIKIWTFGVHKGKMPVPPEKQRSERLPMQAAPSLKADCSDSIFPTCTRMSCSSSPGALQLWLRPRWPWTSTF